MKKKSPTITIDILVIKKDKVLLGKLNEDWTQDKKYLWTLPSKELLHGNNFEDTLKRTLKDNLGLKLRLFNVFCANNFFGFKNHYISIGIIAEVQGIPQITDSDQIIEWRWFSKARLPKKLFPSAELTLRCFLNDKTSIQ